MEIEITPNFGTFFRKKSYGNKVKIIFLGFRALWCELIFSRFFHFLKPKNQKFHWKKRKFTFQI